MRLFGRWNWWLPERVARIFRVEPSPLAPAPADAGRGWPTRAAALVRQRERVEPSGIEKPPTISIKDADDAARTNPGEEPAAPTR